MWTLFKLFTALNEDFSLSNSTDNPNLEENIALAQKPEPGVEMITVCPKCGAPISPSQEDLVVTCRYCGFSARANLKSVAPNAEPKTSQKLNSVEIAEKNSNFSLVFLHCIK